MTQGGVRHAHATANGLTLRSSLLNARNNKARSHPSSSFPSVAAISDNFPTTGTTATEDDALSPSRREFSRALFQNALIAAGVASATPEALAIEPFCGIFSKGDSQLLPGYVYTTPWDENTVNFNGAQTWFRVVGKKKAERKAGKLPLLCLHGGPGVSSRYLEPLELLSSQNRRVAYYDQFGCGFSSDPREPVEYSLKLFADELDAVRRKLGFEEVHLLGHGWGGMVALEYLLDGGNAKGVASLTLSGVPPSTQRQMMDRQLNLERLAPAIQEALRRGDDDPAARTTFEFRSAKRVYDRKHLSARLPDCITASEELTSEEAVLALTGGLTFREAGILAGWSVEERLHELSMPVLLTRGTYDEVSPSTLAFMDERIPSSRVRNFAGGSCSHIDDWEAYLEELDNFYSLVEGSGGEL
ncbi:hypothetical protein CYMTET_37221 [Cymbomonas tetramitiformis]|uniref:AB hydrolase-1 domain-containing protein n=1 Tax=Cymbomonas tetramitiformis TaxID=36881 RepID=A0AAE0F672_9CHLO|nr:hypothetical protein CYMTET_37221 [Cymbomonas tetramitiformis]